MKCAKGDTASGKENHIPFCNTTFCTTASAIVCKYVICQPEQQEGMGGIENIEEIFHFPAVGSVFSRIHRVKIYGQHFGSGNAALLFTLNSSTKLHLLPVPNHLLQITPEIIICTACYIACKHISSLAIIIIKAESWA